MEVYHSEIYECNFIYDFFIFTSLEWVTGFFANVIACPLQLQLHSQCLGAKAALVSSACFQIQRHHRLWKMWAMDYCSNNKKLILICNDCMVITRKILKQWVGHQSGHCVCWVGVSVANSLRVKLIYHFLGYQSLQCLKNVIYYCKTRKIK